MDSLPDKDQIIQEEAKQKEVQEWLDQVHFGSCCSDDVEECEASPSKEKKRQ
jgi:hypothetical protein